MEAKLASIPTIREQIHRNGSVTYEMCERLLGEREARGGLEMMLELEEVIGDVPTQQAWEADVHSGTNEWEPLPHDAFYPHRPGVNRNKVELLDEEITKWRNRALGKTALAVGAGMVVSNITSADDMRGMLAGIAVALLGVPSLNTYLHRVRPVRRRFDDGYRADTTNLVVRKRWNRRDGPSNFKF